MWSSCLEILVQSGLGMIPIAFLALPLSKPRVTQRDDQFHNGPPLLLHHIQAPDDRPTGPGEQVGEEHGKGERTSRGETDAGRLRENSGELHSVWNSSPHRERRRRAGSIPGTSAAQTDLQTRYRRFLSIQATAATVYLMLCINTSTRTVLYRGRRNHFTVIICSHCFVDFSLGVPTTKVSSLPTFQAVYYVYSMANTLIIIGNL